MAPDLDDLEEIVQLKQAVLPEQCANENYLRCNRCDSWIETQGEMDRRL